MALFEVKKKAAPAPQPVPPTPPPQVAKLPQEQKVYFTPEEEEWACLIKHRRLQLLIHSYIYYRLDINIIEDAKWSQWAFELVELQAKYPDTAAKVIYHEAFIDWDGSSGAHLPFDEWVVQKATQLLNR